MKVFILIFIVVIVVVGSAFYLFQSSKKPNTDLPGTEVANLGQDHIPQGSAVPTPYNSNPPTSGPHWPEPANWGVYKTTLSDEQVVHNLEHGGIWISYKPDAISAETIVQLEDFAKRYRKVVVEPRSVNDSPIVLAAWTRVQKLDQYDETAILKFIGEFYDQGPEKVP